MLSFATSERRTKKLSWPKSQKAIRHQFQGVPENEVRQMIADNAARLYNLPQATP